MNRRSFLKTGLAAASFAGFGLSRFAYADNSKKIPLALQVYSVREEAAKDLAGTLKKIAAIGYTGVEFAGYYGHSAADVRKMLDDAGLVAVSTHLGVAPLLGDAFYQTVDFEKTLGNKTLMVAGGIGPACCFDAGNQMTAHLFNEISIKAEKVGMRIGFHAHGGDFTDINGTTAWDLFFSRTRPEVIAQMDVGNTLAAGADPYAAIEKFPGRGKLIHVKSNPGHAAVAASDDEVDWKRVIDLCTNVAGTEWYIIEQEGGPEGVPVMDMCRKSYENFTALI
ncbi:MAG: TIM barrel protein [Planctomycetia bacterium]|nr:TIM barrel protein [Planctomycetia bacterium]